MLSRVIWSILGVAWWQKAFRDRHNNESLNQEVIDRIEYPIKCICIAMLPVGVLVNICGWYSRRFANLITVYEVLVVMLQMLVPYNYGDF